MVEGLIVLKVNTTNDQCDLCLSTREPPPTLSQPIVRARPSQTLDPLAQEDEIAPTCPGEELVIGGVRDLRIIWVQIVVVPPRITDKEKADRLAAGQCFVCGGSDHFSQDCPTKKIVKSSGGKPPGASSFNIEPSISENEADASVEVLDSLPVGAIPENL